MVDFNDFWSNLLNCGSFAHDFFLLLPLPYQVHLWHIALLLLVLLGVVRAIVFEGRRRRRFGLGMLLCAAVLFGVPMLTKPQERYAALALIPMAALVAMNGRWFVGRPMRGRPVWWPIAACIVLAGGLVFVARGGFRHDVLTRSLVVEAEVVAQWIERNPTRGIMAQIGYPPELAYLTDRRVLGLPGDPKLFEVALRHYDISHIVVGSAYHRRWDWPDRSEVWNAATIDYIRSRPEAFRRVALLHQPVDGGRNRDEFLILEVDTTWLHAPSESPSDRDDDGS
jgi:hypothetical protein